LPAAGPGKRRAGEDNAAAPRSRRRGQPWRAAHPRRQSLVFPV